MDKMVDEQVMVRGSDQTTRQLADRFTQDAITIGYTMAIYRGPDRPDDPNWIPGRYRCEARFIRETVNPETEHPRIIELPIFYDDLANTEQDLDGLALRAFESVLVNAYFYDGHRTLPDWVAWYEGFDDSPLMRYCVEEYDTAHGCWVMMRDFLGDLMGSYLALVDTAENRD